MLEQDRVTLLLQKYLVHKLTSKQQIHVLIKSFKVEKVSMVKQRMNQIHQK